MESDMATVKTKLDLDREDISGASSRFCAFASHRKAIRFPDPPNV
jgi:hypothetical protein